jgi:hypothetical protein
MSELMVFCHRQGFLGATRKVSQKNFVGFEDFSPCFAHKKSENFLENHFS